MSEIREAIVSVTTTGGAGAATGNGNSEKLHGWLLDIYLDYHASAPATTDVTVSQPATTDVKGTTIATKGNLIVVSNNATDGLYAPRQTEHDVSGTSLGAGGLYPLDGPLNVAVAQADALTNCVVAYIRYVSL